MSPEGVRLMAFSHGKMGKVRAALQGADWTEEDVNLLIDASRERRIEIRDSLRATAQGEIIAAIENGEVDEFRTDRQKARGGDTGRVILAILQEQNLLAGCLDEQELKAIQAKGISFYRQHFTGKYLPGWRGVRDARVPVLYEYGGKVILRWFHLVNRFNASLPALRRKPAKPAGK